MHTSAVQVSQCLLESDACTRQRSAAERTFLTDADADDAIQMMTTIQVVTMTAMADRHAIHPAPRPADASRAGIRHKDPGRVSSGAVEHRHTPPSSSLTLSEILELIGVG